MLFIWFCRSGLIFRLWLEFKAFLFCTYISVAHLADTWRIFPLCCCLLLSLVVSGPTDQCLSPNCIKEQQPPPLALHCPLFAPLYPPPPKTCLITFRSIPLLVAGFPLQPRPCRRCPLARRWWAIAGGACTSSSGRPILLHGTANPDLDAGRHPRPQRPGGGGGHQAHPRSTTGTSRLSS